MRFKDFLTEKSVSRAQQAAIAISKKEKGEEPKNEDAEEKAKLAVKHAQEKEALAQKHEREKESLSNEEYLDSIDHILDEEFGFAMFEEEIIKERDGVYNIKGVKIVLKKKGDKYHATMDGKDAGTHDSEKKAMQWISKKMYLSPKAQARYAEGKSVLGDARTILYREKLKRLGYVKEEFELDEATIKDIKDILTTIGSSKNMDQAVQMVMKKYKVDQGKAKAMVKKAIDSGVTYDKIKKKYAKESVELDEATRVSRKDFDKLKKGSMITIDYGSGIRGSTKRTFMVKGKSRSAKYNVDKVNMVDPQKPGGMKFHLYSRDGEDATLALGDMGATINSYSIKESVELDEASREDKIKQTMKIMKKYPANKGKSEQELRKGAIAYLDQKKESIEEKRDAGKSATGYDIYHDTYSAAMQHAYAHAKKKHGVTVRPSEIDDKVASGPRKPSNGKTVSHILKTDKKQNLHVQVYNTGRKYELNMYVESVEEALAKPAKPVTGNEIKRRQNISKTAKKNSPKTTFSPMRNRLGENTIDLARDVVKNKGAKKGLDMQTANAILTVYDKVNDANKKKMEKMPVDKLTNAVWKILNKAS